MRQLSGSDAFFLFSDRPGQHQHISTIYLYDPSTAPGGRVGFEAFRSHVQDRLDFSPLFRQKLVKVPLNLDYPYWVDDTRFSLDHHLEHVILPSPSDWGTFCELVSRLHAQPLDLGRPVWEMYLIEGLDDASVAPKGTFAVLSKVHHAAIDDETDEDITHTLHDEATPAARRARSRGRGGSEPGALQMLTLAWFNNTTKILETGQALWKNLPFFGAEALDPEALLPGGVEAAPETRFDQEISPGRAWGACSFSMADIDRIMDRVPRAALNEVVLTICGGGIRKYLESKGELPRKSLWALLPVHIRRSGDQDVPGHRVQLTRSRIMSDVGDPLDRLERVTAEVARVWEHSLGAREINDVQDILPASTMTMAARTIAARFGPGRKYRENHNMVVNIIPGPEEPAYLLGARLVAYTGMGIILDHLALSHTVTTYREKLTIAPVCDRDIMPDPAFYVQCLRDAFEELKSAARR